MLKGRKESKEKRVKTLLTFEYENNFKIYKYFKKEEY